MSAAVMLVPTLRDTVMVFMARRTLCDWAEARQFRKNSQLLDACVDKAKAGCRVVQKKPGLWLWDTPEGRMWTVPNQLLSTLIAEMAFKRAMAGPDKAVRPGDVVLDCGANVGVSVKEALSLGAKRVIAIEPSPRNIECLRRNFQSEIRAGRVVVYEKGSLGP